MIHELKTWPEYFQEVLEGKKLFEVRKDDRLFNVGDTLELIEYDPYEKTFSGRKVFAKITYKLNGGKFGIEVGFCVLGFEIIGKYYYLKEGDIVQDGDEVEMSNTIHDGQKWVKSENSIGTAAPDPQFVSHRKFRRLIFA